MEATAPAADTLTASQRYYRAHRVQRQQYGREYYAKNREAILAASAAKREAERPRPAPIPADTRQAPRGDIFIENDVTISFE
jgi:hypothetical protein